MQLAHHERVLVLAAHADDGEIGCGGSIARYVDVGAAVYYVAFSTAKASVLPESSEDVLEPEGREATAVLAIRDRNLRIFGFLVHELLSAVQMPRIPAESAVSSWKRSSVVPEGEDC